MGDRDLYDILGVERTASPEEIKRAYRKLAKKHHPDHNPNDPKAEIAFKEIQHAYSVLKDKDKREHYDRFGHFGAGDFQTDQTGHNVYTWGTGGSRINVEDLEDLFSGFSSAGAAERGPFERFFRQAGVGQGRKRSRPVRGKDLRHRINLAFEQAILGATVEVDIPSATSGANQGETLNVKIPPGIEDGKRIRLKNKGMPGTDGGPRGDMFLICAVRPHRYFRREERDVYIDLPLTIPEAALGTKVDVPTLAGVITLTIPPGTSGGTKLRLKGRGVPAHGGKPAGDQFIVVRVIVPKHLTAEQVKLMEQLAATLHDNPRAEFQL
jgi:DnaJ-class molecular chaperone